MTRLFLLLLICLTAHAQTVTFSSVVRQNDLYPTHYSSGDTWTTAWSSDGVIYSLTDDSYGPNFSLSASGGRNMMLSSISSDLTTVAQVNSLPDYGHIAQVIDTDNATWKGSGMISIGGTLYLSHGIYRWTFAGPGTNFNFTQTIGNGSIIKSTDHGATWINSGNNANGTVRDWLNSTNITTTAGVSRAEGAALSATTTGMFSDPRFSALYFVQYGQDGAEPTVEGNDTYVYGTSSNGYWNGGDFYTLGRCLKSAIGNLSASDWQYFKGGIGGSVTSSGNWSSNINLSTPIFTNTGHTSMAGAYWIPAIGKYIICNWYYPTQASSIYFTFADNSMWQILAAPTLSGPWVEIATKDMNVGPAAGYYSPTPSLAHSSGGTIKLLFAGNFAYNTMSPTVTSYSLNSLDMTITYPYLNSSVVKGASLLGPVVVR